MRITLVVASLLAALLYFMLSDSCACAAAPGARICRDTTCPQAARGASLWSLGNRFSLLNLPLRAL